MTISFPRHFRSRPSVFFNAEKLKAFSSTIARANIWRMYRKRAGSELDDAVMFRYVYNLCHGARICCT